MIRAKAGVDQGVPWWGNWNQGRHRLRVPGVPHEVRGHLGRVAGSEADMNQEVSECFAPGIP